MVNVLEENKVIIAIPSFDGHVSILNVPCLSRLVKPEHLFMIQTGMFVDYQRNKIIQQALKLKGEFSDWTHIWFLDSDVVPYDPLSLVKLLQRDEDVVSGLYCQKILPIRWLVMKDNKLVKIYEDDPMNFTGEYKDKTIPVDSTGAGCLLLKREVIKKMIKPWFKVEYKELKDESDDLKILGEDLYFFKKCIQSGYQPYVDTTVICRHMQGRVAYPHDFLGKKDPSRSFSLLED